MQIIMIFINIFYQYLISYLNIKTHTKIPLNMSYNYQETIKLSHMAYLIMDDINIASNLGSYIISLYIRVYKHIMSISM